MPATTPTCAIIRVQHLVAVRVGGDLVLVRWEGGDLNRKSGVQVLLVAQVPTTKTDLYQIPTGLSH